MTQIRQCRRIHVVNKRAALFAPKPRREPGVQRPAHPSAVEGVNRLFIEGSRCCKDALLPRT